MFEKVLLVIVMASTYLQPISPGSGICWETCGMPLVDFRLIQLKKYLVRRNCDGSSSEVNFPPIFERGNTLNFKGPNVLELSVNVHRTVFLSDGAGFRN